MKIINVTANVEGFTVKVTKGKTFALLFEDTGNCWKELDESTLSESMKKEIEKIKNFIKG